MNFFLSTVVVNSSVVFLGALLCLSFSPFDYSFLIFIVIALFKESLSEISAKKAAFRGFLFGLGMFGTGVPWVYVSMTLNIQGFSIPAMLMTLLFCSFWAIFPAIFAYLYIKLRRDNIFDVFFFASSWVLIEYIRGELVLNGFPWLQVAYSQLDSPLSAYIPIFGVYGTSFIIVLSAFLMADTVKKRCFFRFFIISVIILGGLALKNITWVQAAGDSFKATLIQGNIAQKNKWRTDNKKATLLQYYADTVKNWDSELIIWPETAIPAYYNDVKESYLLPLQQEAVANNTDIMTSLPYKNEQGQLYNAVVVLGENHALYKKIHLLPFGEYLPWQPISGYLLKLAGMSLGQFSAGEINQPLLKVAGYSVVTSICYEDAFGSQSIHQIKQARFLVNLTNDGWFDGSIEPYQHMQIARMRALESGRYLLRATNTGVTAVISEKGEVLKQAPIAKRAIMSAMVIPMKGLTPYAQLGNKAVLYLAFLLLLILIGIHLFKSDRL